MLRELGTFERALYISDRHSPFNVIGVVQLDHPPSPDILKNALELLQLRHPLLQVRIANAHKRPRFEIMPDIKLPLSIIQRNESNQWEEIVEQEMTKRFDITHGPLFRVSYLHADKKAEIIITFYHSIMDAVSGTNLIDELLEMAAFLQFGNQKESSTVELAQPVEELFPPAFKDTRRIPAFLTYLFSQMFEEMAYRWKVRGKRVARVKPGGNGRILSLILPEAQLESISQQARLEKVTLNSLLNACMLLAVNRHLYNGASQPMQTFTFANLRPYLQPPSPKEELVNHISMLRYTVNVSGNANIWDLTRNLHARIYPSLKHGGKFIAAIMSESLMKMFTRVKSIRMAATGLNYTAAVAMQKTYGEIKVTGLHAYISTMDIGPELSAQARIFNDQLWMDLMYLDSDMDASLAKKIRDEIKLILEEAVAES